MSLRFLILNTDYVEFLRWLYAQHPGLEKQAYKEQMQVRNESLFGVADFYSQNLRKLGHDAYDIHANNEFMQKAWASEQGIRVEKQALVRKNIHRALRRARYMAAKTPLHHLKSIVRPVLAFLNDHGTWFYNILARQIQQYRPDVLLNQDMASIGTGFLREIKPHVRLLVGQIASPLPQGENYGPYDIVISSLPNIVSYFRKNGIKAELHRFAFEPDVLPRLNCRETRIPVSFVGSLSWHHASRIRLLEYLTEKIDMRVWGQGIEGLSENSPIRRHYKDNAWGIEMYQILRSSDITLNHHIGVAKSYANNMRLFEATGVGTLLVTDWKENLHEMFEPEKEVVTYRSPEECSEVIRYYLEHEEERQRIARAGQERTLREHTYAQRMAELVEIVKKYL